jgi:hypothetical protein
MTTAYPSANERALPALRTSIPQTFVGNLRLILLPVRKLRKNRAAASKADDRSALSEGERAGIHRS